MYGHLNELQRPQDSIESPDKINCWRDRACWTPPRPGGRDVWSRGLVSNGQKTPGLDRVEKHRGPLKSTKSWSLLNLLPRHFFSNFYIVFEKVDRLSLPEGSGLVTNMSDAARELSPPSPHLPQCSGMRSIILHYVQILNDGVVYLKII